MAGWNYNDDEEETPFEPVDGVAEAEHDKKIGYQITPEMATLKLYVSTFYALQDHRIKIGNRIFALTNFLDVEPAIAESLHARLIGKKVEGVRHHGIKDVEEAVGKDIEKIVHQHPLWKYWLKDVKGIGPILAGGWISTIGNPERFPNVGKLYAYSGQHTVPASKKYVERFIDEPRIRDLVLAGAVIGDPNSELRMAPRREKGKKANWSPFLRTLAWKTGESFVKASKGQYRVHYDRNRAYYEIHRSKTTDAHRYAMAKRKTVKLFMSHLWQVWREIEGLPVRMPYAIEYLGHTTFIEPPDWNGVQ